MSLDGQLLMQEAYGVMRYIGQYYDIMMVGMSLWSSKPPWSAYILAMLMIDTVLPTAASIGYIEY